MKKIKPTLNLCEDSLKKENSMGSVVIEILSYRQKTLLLNLIGFTGLLQKKI